MPVMIGIVPVTKGRLLAVSFVMLVGIFFTGCQPKNTELSMGASDCEPIRQMPDHSVHAIRIGRNTWDVEVVNSAASIQQGLSGRTEVGADGMLFSFPSPAQQTFWMKDMLFDLDLLWISNCQIVEVTPSVPKPAPGISTTELPTYTSNQAVDMVLEVPAGAIHNSPFTLVGQMISL